jgi:hypothetical protein
VGREDHLQGPGPAGSHRVRLVRPGNRRDRSRDRGAPDQWELDLDLTYTFSSGCLKGLQIKTRAALIDIEGTSGILPDVRLILNWPLPLLWPLAARGSSLRAEHRPGG